MGLLDRLERGIEKAVHGVFSTGSKGQVQPVEIASRLRAGQVSINGAGGDLMAPFGGFKMSGNGREWGDYAFHEVLETKAVLGYAPKEAAEEMVIPPLQGRAASPRT